ncbi:hypothetical protein IW146_000157 [Coemansia sp. RSA 922]|nr:hypothetical protein H4S03_007039 [Coemansia sp. S3946]KAJ2048518.1 hypothetical protein H4S04_003779 [Coemansia sp. S16]KAJ2064295.1 hypothetical protein GGI08_002410 [Coemansia sp. S2]KAJ2075649.1 hypothetical protein GGH13_000462 [Coemansia sp. S155-1]KAJ2118133.1 hypothetical protein IW146_000157 [Coemansia sp. RSA 922]KAJ2432148.1 hypothetical protein GGF41_000166 [Coemansia sp. RSA 2531]
MASLPPFQTLPMLIVLKVVDYLEERPRNTFDTDIDIDLVEYNEANTVCPLIWVSERWRVAALSIICDNCEVNFDSSPRGFSVSYPALPLLPDNNSFSQYHMEKLVKRVVVLAPSWSDIGSRKFRITPSLPKFPIFPSAATLMVCLDEDDVNPQKAGRGVANPASAAPPNRNKETVDFVRSIRRLTPAATGVVVFFRSPSSTNKKNRGQCNTLLLQLCQGKTTRLHVQSWTDCTLSSLKLRSVSGLTSITQGLITACAPFAQLAYLNAGTLKDINLKNVDESDWRTIIYGDTETPAVYSSLIKLGLLPAEAPYDRTWAAIEDAVLFPALIELDVMDDYPFNDDLLFRGNGRTLRKLCIPFRVLTKNVLGRFNVFSRSGVTRMNLVDIDIAAHQDSAILLGQASTHIVQQIHSILEATTMLYLQGDTANRHMLNAVKSAPATAVLQSLELYNPPLDACDILTIISAIPSLVTLTCEIDGSVASIEALSASEHPTAIHEKYSSLNSNFRQLYVLDDEDDDDYEDDWSDENDSVDLHGVHECPCCGGFHYDSEDDILNDIYGDHYYGDGYSDIDDEGEDVDDDDDEDDDEYEDVDDEDEEDQGEDDDKDEAEVDEADKDLLAREIAVVAVQIAVLCPNFKHVDLPEEMRNEFSREVALAMANGPFLPYADSLERLIFSE